MEPVATAAPPFVTCRGERFRLYLDEPTLQRRIREMGRQIAADYAGTEPPIFIGVLNGAYVFVADLMRHLEVHCAIDFMAVASYGSSTDSSGVVRILKDLDTVLEGREVLIVEDIVDSGLTLAYLLDVLRRRNPADVRVVALFVKDKPDQTPVQVDYVGFTIPDAFVVGYGLDARKQWRNLPFLAAIDVE